MSERRDRAGAWRGRLHRWRWWIVAIALLVGMRALLPVVLRRVVASQASQVLNAEVKVGDVDLELWRGGLALERVAIRAKPAAATEPGDEAAGTAAEPGGTTAPAAPRDHAAPPPVPNPPIIAFKRFALSVRYLPLFSRTVQLRDVELDGPRVALDRLASGELNLAALVPTHEVAVAAGATSTATATTTASSDEAATAAGSWNVAVDRFVLRNGRLRFRDLKAAGSEPVEVGIDQVTVDEIALSPGVYGEPAQAHVRLGVEGGAIDLNAQYRMLGTGIAVRCDVNAERLPLRHARWYVPKVGWSDLKGEVDLAMTYELQTETEPKSAVHGTLALRDVAVTVPNLQDVAVSWRRLGIDIEDVDLLAQRAAIRDVSLDGATLSVRARGDQPLPVLAQSAPAPVAEESPTPAADTGVPPPEPARPWDWRVAAVAINESTIRVLSDQPTLEVGVGITARDLAGAEDALGHVAVALGLGASAVKLDGDVRITPPAFGGTLQVTDLTLPPLLAVSGRVDPAILPSATLGMDLAIAAGLPATSGAAPEPNLLAVNGTVGVRDVRVVLPGEGALSVGATSVELTLADTAVPGIIPIGRRAEAGASVRLDAQLKIAGAQVDRAGEQALAASVESLGLTLSDVSAPAAMAGLAPFESNQPLAASARLDLTQPRVVLGDADLAAQADSISLAVTDASATVIAPGGSAADAVAHLAAALHVTAARVAIAGGAQLDAGARSIDVKVGDLTVPGVAIGAAPVDTGRPMHVVAAVALAEPRAARADGKEFAFSAKSIAVPVTDFTATGLLAPAPAPAPLRATLGDVRIDAPAIRITRTKGGIILPAASAQSSAAPPAAPRPAAAQSAPPAPPPHVAIAALRVTNGTLELADRAVQPAFHTRLAPIEIDARDVRWPDASVKPVRVEITSAEQGRLTLNGTVGPQGGKLELAIADWPLAPFTPYATAYSPYSIGNGALEIKSTATFRGGKYDVANRVTLHQLDLGGAEGDSLFQQQFGIPLTLALALLRDASGDITLNVPVQVDQSGGASVDTVAVVRTALRQALMGAVQSPLKLVGGVLGAGGKGGAIAPAPIAFQVGRTEPTGAGKQSAARLAEFLTSRPGMAVDLSAQVTADDVRWLREQALRAEWHDEGFVQRSIGFLVSRGPRERIGSYLAARADGSAAPALSAEDAATLQKWLDERPSPSADALRALAVGRLAAIDAVLRDKAVDPGRIAHAEPVIDPADGPPVVRISFHPLAAVAGGDRLRQAP